MRSYTNKQGDKIVVSKEHLDTAVRIKLELQKLSPSRKCSWSLLSSMMEREGFYDSENNESYRCMIKDYQKSIGNLPEAPKYAEMVTEGKLESIKELVGEMAYEKRENQHVLKELNKAKRDVIDFALTAEQIGIALKNHNFDDLKFKAEPIPKIGNTRMVVSLTDLHIGAIVDNEYNSYNYFVAQERMQQYLNKVVSECKQYNISEVDVVNLGDVIEHSSMRYSQGYGVEFVFSEQISKASDLIIKFLQGLSEERLNVSYAGFAGNHDRIQDKDKNIDGDHAVRSINKVIETFIKYSQNKRITYVQANDYNHNLEVNGRKIKFVHGDLDSLKDETLVAKHTTMDGINYDMVVMGHYHHFREVEVGLDKRIITFGSLKGVDDYAMRIRKYSCPSQGIIIIHENGEIDVKRVKLY